MQVVTSSERLNKAEAAKVLGLKVYDTALPQGWLDELVDVLMSAPTAQVKGRDYVYGMALSSLVWSYDGSLMGMPHPLTVAMFGWLKYFDAQKGSHYAQDGMPVLLFE